MLPFVGLVAAYLLGVDLSGPLYWVLVGSLVVTAGSIWAESLAALDPPPLPGEPDEPAPRATAVIAAYLPNEADTIMETLDVFLAQEYSGELQVLLAYNTPTPLAVEAELFDLARMHPYLTVIKVEDSSSKAQNVNAALRVANGEIVGIFDADHHPMPGAFERAWRWIADGADVVQGHCVIRNGDDSTLAKIVAVEFEQIYSVSHPGRAALHGFGIFGGSNGYWRASTLEQIRLRGSFLTEDIEASMRVLAAGGRIVNDPGLISRELAPETLGSLWKQRMRWAQGWFQVSIRHLGPILASPLLSLRQKIGATYLLGWREVYPWLVMLVWPLMALPDLARRRARPDLAGVRAGDAVHRRLRPAADAGRLAAGHPRPAPAPQVVPRRRRGQPLLLHRVQEPDRPRRAPQAAAWRAPVGGHPAHRRELGLPSVLPLRRGGGCMTTLTDTTPTVPPTETPRASRPLYPLTWARGLAAILVLTFHAYQHNRTWPSGSWPWSGTAHQLMLGTDLFVEMFFVLSGLVLWLPIARACIEGRAGRPGWVMLLRRMARLLPLYYAVVLVVWTLTNPSLPGHWQDLLLHLTFTQVYSDQYVFWTAGPAWSLAVEFHFYVLMALSVPVVHALARRAARPGRPGGGGLRAAGRPGGRRAGLPLLGDPGRRHLRTPTGRSGSPRSRGPRTSASAWAWPWSPPPASGSPGPARVATTVLGSAALLAWCSSVPST